MRGDGDEFEESIFRELRGRKIPIIVAFNKSDLAQPQAAILVATARGEDSVRRNSGQQGSRRTASCARR